MSEREFKVEHYGVDYGCEMCGSGIMANATYLGSKILGEKRVWEHTCSNCGATELLPEKYPNIRYRRI